MKKTSKIQKAVQAVRRNTVKVINPIQSAPKTTYKRITKNIYFDGYSYRARIMVNGIMNSRNFSSQRKATIWRNEVRRTA